MTYVLLWLLVAVPCFFVTYCNGADLNGRLITLKHKDGFWKFHKNFFREGFRLLIHDYFGVYCPWSWARARRHRLADMRLLLGERGLHHDRLGHITAADCDNPDKQEAIARETYISRTAQWVRGVLHFLIAPIPGSLFMICMAIVCTLELGRNLLGKRV
ncbi:hypothetical protein HYZ98_00755 [Candidatus Peregrinibacteria bacterium]|nr:hypothetical protein [Candidatus Peregrinibacteria bacterium]